MHIRRRPCRLTHCFALEEHVAVAVSYFVFDACWDGDKGVVALLPGLACEILVGGECEGTGRPHGWFCVCGWIVVFELFEKGLGVERNILEHLCVGVFVGRAETTEACVVLVVFLDEELGRVTEGGSICRRVDVGVVAWKELVPV